MRADGKTPNQPQLGDTEIVGEKKTVHNVFLLDASGSMNEGRPTKYANASAGLNELLKSVSEDTDTNNTVSIMEFDTQWGGQRINWHVFKSTEKIPSFKGRGAEGGTPLNDAIGKALTEIMANKHPEDKVIVTIFTDGQELHSHTYSYSDVRRLIEQGKLQGVTVSFVGTEYDTKQAITNYNIFASNTMTYDGTSRGLQAAMTSTLKSRTEFSKKVARGEDVTKDFFSKSVDKDSK